MVRKFSIDPEAGRIHGETASGRSFFDTAAYPVQFFPLADKISVTKTITFPDVHKTFAYGFVSGDTGGGVIRQSCSSFVSIPYQEWGPSDQPSMSDNLSDEVIGVAPAGTTVLLVRVKLARTHTPSPLNGVVPSVLPQEGQWVMCDGGTLLLENYWPILKMVWIRLASTPNVDGTINILMTRRISVRKKLQTFMQPDNSDNSTGWTWAGGTGDQGHYGFIVSLIQSKGPSIAINGVITYRRDDGGHCSMVDTTDYSSVYSADFEIIPGRHDIDVESIGGGGSNVGFGFVDFDAKNVVSSTHTFTSKFLGVAPTGTQTRHVIVAVTSYISQQTSSKNMLGCTIGGVVASQVAKSNRYINATGSNDSNVITALFIAEVPTGDTGDIVLTFNASFWGSQIDVYAAYNLQSAVPDATGVFTDSNTHPQNLATVNDGIALMVSVTSNAFTGQTLTGMENPTVEFQYITTPASRQMVRMRGFQRTTGSTLAVSPSVYQSWVQASFH